MIKIAAVAALTASIAVAASAQTPPPASVQAGTYAVEPIHTRVLFAVSHMGFSTWYGEFTGVSGSLKLDPANAATDQLDVSIPVGSVTTTNTKLDGELKSADWFDAATYPAITFHSTKVTVTSPGQADVLGDLTFHGVTKPVVLHATYKGSGTNMITKGYTVGFDITGHIRRSDFGIGKYVPLIGDEVDLIISTPFELK